MTIPDFSVITEGPDTRASQLQLKILRTRYDFAARHSAGRVVLEAACGAGVGLGLLARTCAYVIGGDIDPKNCASAKGTYTGRENVAVAQIDAERTPFRDGSFDVVILFEALYYLRDAAMFFNEARRLLTPGGLLLISTVNCEWPEFNPSPFSTSYHTASQLHALAAQNGFRASLSGAFPDIKAGPASVLTGRIKQLAVKYKLVPKTMKGKEWLKMVFYGKLEPIPRDLAESATQAETLVPLLPQDDATPYRMLYAVCART
jgi:SAM-dependent methyltransferase